MIWPSATTSNPRSSDSRPGQVDSRLRTHEAQTTSSLSRARTARAPIVPPEPRTRTFILRSLVARSLPMTVARTVAVQRLVRAVVSQLGTLGSRGDRNDCRRVGRVRAITQLRQRCSSTGLRRRGARADMARSMDRAFARRGRVRGRGRARTDYSGPRRTASPPTRGGCVFGWFICLGWVRSPAGLLARWGNTGDHPAGNSSAVCDGAVVAAARPVRGPRARGRVPG